MAETALSLVVTKEMLDRLQKADHQITDLATKSEQASKRIISAFTEMGQKGVGAFINKLNEAQNKIASLNNIKIQGADFSQFTNNTTQAIDAVNRLTTAMNKVSKGSEVSQSASKKNTIFAQINEQVPSVITNIHNVEQALNKITVGDKTYSNSALTKINAEIDTAMKKLGEVNKMLQFYAKGEGKKAIGFVDTTSYQKEAKELMNIIDLLQRQRQSIIANSQLRMKVAQQEEAQANRYVAMENERRERIQANAKLESDLARKRTNDAKKNYEEQYKAYERMFDEIERRERKLAQQQAKNDSRMRKKDYERYVSIQDTYSHAMNISNRAKTLNQELRAIKALEQARGNLNKTDSQYAAKLSALNNAIRQHKQNIDRVTQSSKNLQNSHRGLMNISEQLTRRLALVFSVSQITGYVNKLISVRGEFELQQRTLQAILQNKDAANKLWQQTVDLAVRSPFRVKELVTYTKQLAAYRVETEKLHDTTKMLADVSAGLGVDMQRLILAFGQVKAANYLRGTELRQFSEAGINILGELATYFTELEGVAVSVGEVFERVSKRMVSFTDVEEIFKRLTSAGGTFYRMQEIQSNTLRGMISNLKDSIDLMLNDIGQSNEGVIKNVVKLTKNLVESWEVLANMLKIVVTGFALYKVNALLTGDAIKLLAIDMGILTGTIPKQLTLLQLLQVGWAKLTTTIKSTTLAMKTLMATYWPVLAIMALVTAIIELVTWNKELNEQMKELNDRRDEELSQINNLTRAYQKLNEEQQKEGANSNVIFNEKLKKLKELQNLMGDAKFAIPITSEPITQENIDEIFAETEELLRFARAWGYDLGVEIAKGINGAEGWFHIFGDNILSDLKDLDDATSRITGSITHGLDKVVRSLQADYDNLSDEAKYYLEYIEKGRRNNETEEEWLERKVSLLQNIYNSYKTKKPKELKDIESELLHIETQRKEVAYELNKVINRLIKAYGVTDFSHLSQEQKILLKTEIDKVFEQQQLSEQTKRFAAHFIANKLKIPVEFITPEDTGKGLLDWQTRYNEFIKGLTTKSVSAIRDVTQTREALRKTIKEQIGQQQDIINSYNVKGQEAYSTAEMEEAEKKIKDLTEAYVWLGGAIDSLKEKNKKDEQVKILNNRIKLLKDINKEYKELNKTFDANAAKQKVFESFSDTFKQAFEGTGINLRGLLIDKDKLNQLKKEGEESGQVFSESMLQKMNEVISSGTYIRSASDVFKEVLRQDEGVRYELYDDKTGKVIRNAQDFANKVGTATIGIGHAVSNFKEAAKFFGRTLTDTDVENLFNADVAKHEEALNRVLDDYNELILTQEQYDALLNKTYQGGGGAIRSALEYATNIEAGLAHFEKIDAKLKAVGASFDMTFGHDFIDKFKKAQTVVERLALVLQTINLTTQASGGNIDTNLFSGMLKRSKEVAAQFSGDLKLVKLLEKASITISEIDFTNIEGVIATLKRLEPLAKKEGKEAELALSKAISELEVQLGVDAKIKEDKALFDQIEEMFSGYEISLELQKLNIPKDWAKDFFGVESFDLSDIRKRIESELQKEIGEDRRKQLEQDLEKVKEMEVKAQQERLKTYLQYARDAVGERAKIKLEEMRKLQEIEKTFTEPEQEEVKQKAIAKVKKDSEQAQQKLDWEEFQKSDTFINLFSDLDNASSALINHSLTKLREFKEQWKDMPLEDMRAIVGKINELEIALATINPFEGIKDLKKNIKDAIDNTNFSIDAQKFIDKGDYVSAFEIERAYQEERLKASQQEISDIETVLRLKEEGKTIDDISLNLTKNQQLLFALGVNSLRAQLNIQKDISKNAQGGVDNSNDVLIANTKLQKKYAAQADAIGTAQDMANDLYEAFSSLNEALGGGDGIGAIFADMGMQMMNTVLNTLQLQLQLKAAGIQAEIFSYQMNAAMGIIGWIVMAVQLIAQVLGAIFAAHDKRLENQIESLKEKVDELNKKLEVLEEMLDKAFNIRQLEQYTKEVQRNVNAQIQAYEKMIKLEEEKKKTDDEKIKEYKESIEELKETQKELMEDSISTATSGILDSVKDAARDFVDAWYEAFAETGNGLQGLRDNFQEIMLDMVQQQATLGIAGNFLDRWQRELNKYINKDDLELTTKEAKTWVDTVQKELPQLNEALEAYFKAMEQAGVNLGETSDELSGLQRGIQGLSESTGQELAAYLNSIRFFVADTNTKLSQFVDAFFNTEGVNPMLSQLRIIAEQTTAIHTLLDSLTTPHPTLSGRGLKVVL